MNKLTTTLFSLSLLHSCFTAAMEAPPLTLPTMEDAQQPPVTRLSGQQSLKVRTVEIVAKLLQKGTLSVAAIEQTWGQDLKDLIKDKLIRNNLPFFASLFGAHESCVLTGHTDKISAFALSPENSHALTASDDHTVRLWDLSQKPPVSAIIIQNPALTSAAAFSTDFTKALTCSRIGEGINTRVALSLQNLTTTPSANQILGTFDHAITALALSPNGYAFVGGMSRTASLYNLKTGNFIELQGHGNLVTSVAFSQTGQTILTGCSDGRVRLWDFQSGHIKLVTSVKATSAGVSSVALSPCGKYALLSNDSHNLYYWDITKNYKLTLLAGHHKMVKCVSISPCGRFALSCSHDRSVRLWDLQKPPIKSEVIASDGEGFESASFNQDERYVLLTKSLPRATAHITDLYGPASKLSLTQLLLVLAADSSPEKAGELKKACEGIENLVALNKLAHEAPATQIMELVKHKPLWLEVAKLSSEQRIAIINCGFNRHFDWY